MKKWTLVVASTLILLTLIAVSSGPLTNQLLEQGKSCTADEDCTMVSLGCGFGLEYLNKESRDRVVFAARVHQLFFGHCAYSVQLPPGLPRCDAGQCAAIVCKPTVEYGSGLRAGDFSNALACNCPAGMKHESVGLNKYWCVPWS